MFLPYMIVLLCILPIVESWTYSGAEGPVNWAKKYPACNGTKQSPINIKLDDVKFNSTLTSPVYASFDEVLQGTKFSFKNNGHTVQVTIEQPTSSGNKSQKVSLFGNEWIPWQFHFHWATTDKTGSEHTIDSKGYPLELHLVHGNSKYFPNTTQLLGNSDGLMVMSIKYEIGSEDTTLKKLTDVLTNISYKNKQIAITPFKLVSLLPNDTASYYHYSGSLTTPGCQQVVSWVVFKERRHISATQIGKFRTELYHEKKNSNKSTLIALNHRDPQPLNGRTVFSNFKVKASGGSQGLAPISLFYLVLSCLCLFMN